MAVREDVSDDPKMSENGSGVHAPEPWKPEVGGRGQAVQAGGDGEHADKKPQEPPKRWSTRKKIILGSIIAFVVIAGGVAGLVWWLHARQFESTDDAFVDAHVERPAPQVAGRVSRVLVDDNQQVAAGDVLVEIDPAKYRVEVEKAEAAVAEATGKVGQAQAQKAVAEASVAQARADVDQAKVTEENAKTQLSRYEGLSKEAVSPQRLDDLRAAARNAEAQRVAMEKKLAAAEAQVELAVNQIQVAQAGVEAAKGDLHQSKLNLSYTTVRAAVAGRVTNRNVQAGDYLTVGQQLMALVPDEVWVTANYKETQLDRMRVGQDVTITVDAYPDVDLHGRVESVQKGSGAWFSLLPPENATGNYVKVVQRVPVKITIDERNSDAYRRLAPGMSVVPKVRVR